MDDETKQDIKINTLEQNYKSMSDKIDDLKTIMVEIKQDIKCFREDSDKKYASKLVEKIVYGLVSMLLVAFIGGVIALVIK
jgi:hypothetical protein